MYAYEIKNELKERFGFATARVTSYVVLYGLEKDGYVKTRWEKRKKYYTITSKGEKLLKDGQKYMVELAEILG
jgi:DNA-binding PadR family transcriptional regulator